MIKFGIIGAGYIANIFAQALNGIGIEGYAIASRDIQKAIHFRDTYGFALAYGSYEAMLEDPLVDCVYVATPHALHYEHMMLALAYGKHVLCEKSFTLNTDQAEKVFAYAKEKNLFVMEAMWTRFLPTIQKTIEIVQDGVIGDIVKLTSDFCFTLDNHNKDSRMFDLDMGAGALLDTGVYNINFAYLFLGIPEQITSNVVLHENGMDLADDIIFHYSNAKAHLYNSFAETKPEDGWIYGTKGKIRVPHFYRAEMAEIYDIDGYLVDAVLYKHKVNGFEYQIMEVINCIVNGKLESEIMSHEETLKIMRLMDQLRADWQLKYPTE
jgi:dihydrodiol dehydrogenase / D-xylose 1-dehydrogenase (NADP)